MSVMLLTKAPWGHNMGIWTATSNCTNITYDLNHYNLEADGTLIVRGCNQLISIPDTSWNPKDPLDSYNMTVYFPDERVIAKKCKLYEHSFNTNEYRLEHYYFCLESLKL